MTARKTAGLRSVKPGEATPRKPRAKTITQAAANGTELELLVAMRTRLAKAVESPTTAARDLASLSKRLLEITREIEAIRSQDGEDGIGEAAATPDEAFDPEAL